MLDFMKFRSFSNPSISIPVVRRHATEYMLSSLYWLFSASLTRGRSTYWWFWFNNKTSYYNALHRLRKAGLIVTKRISRTKTTIYLTNKSDTQIAPIMKPTSLWNKKWNGTWHVLTYDVPEKERHYRDALRIFLNRMHMGCLQRSVWITPHDIRPEYDDLVKTTDIDQYSFLLRSQTSLGHNDHDIVKAAWNLERLHEIQEWFCNVWEENLAELTSCKPSKKILSQLAREEMSAYISAMTEDPLLPHELWPEKYLGTQVYNLHVDFIKAIKKHL